MAMKKQRMELKIWRNNLFDVLYGCDVNFTPISPWFRIKVDGKVYDIVDDFQKIIHICNSKFLPKPNKIIDLRKDV